MARIFKREAAKRDLVAQWVWYAENASVETADRFLTAAESVLTMLSHQPQAGIPMPLDKPEIQGMRRFPLPPGFEDILLFYFPLDDGIDLVRVVRGSRDLERLF